MISSFVLFFILSCLLVWLVESTNIRNFQQWHICVQKTVVYAEGERGDFDFRAVWKIRENLSFTDDTGCFNCQASKQISQSFHDYLIVVGLSTFAIRTDDESRKKLLLFAKNRIFVFAQIRFFRLSKFETKQGFSGIEINQFYQQIVSNRGNSNISQVKLYQTVHVWHPCL